ncbi:hypothetical protein ACFY0R_37760 [Streptomyces sp. NPDC001633]|uniref:hypothetical protein n=1 Tax=Streptomyces sp. NPDC001633 TaxID=3364595 RepID=UPI00368BE19A
MNQYNRVGVIVGGPFFAVLGAHGGAGTTTVARFLDPDGSGGSLELARGQSMPAGFVPVVVARSTAYGMRSAAHLLGTWHPSIPRPWLVIVKDAPLAAPKPVAFRRHTLQRRVLGIADVPYLVHLRSVDTPDEALTQKAVQRAARQLRVKLGLSE